MKVGDKVRCLTNFKPLNGEIVPIKGHIYTIRSIEKRTTFIGIRLMEIWNAPRAYKYKNGEIEYHECLFEKRGFQDIDSKIDYQAELLIDDINLN